MKKTIITISLVTICTVVLLFCFRYISGAQGVSLEGGEYTVIEEQNEAQNTINNEEIASNTQSDKPIEVPIEENGEDEINGDKSDAELRAEEIKDYIKDRVIPVVVGVLTSLSALLASLAAIKKSLSRLSGARDDFKNEANERRNEFARQSALLEAKAHELGELARLLPQLEGELAELKKAQQKLNKEAYNIGKMVSLGFSGSQAVVRSGNGRRIAALLGECRALSGKNDDEDDIDLQLGVDKDGRADTTVLLTENSEEPKTRTVKKISKKEREGIKNEEN